MMMDKAPKLHLDENSHGRTRYLLEDSRNDFPYEQWVPTIADIMNARTVKEQKAALCTGIILVGASYEGLAPTKGRRAYYRDSARFRIAQDGEASLSYIKAAVGNIGYQAPTENKPHPAFAVVDSLGGQYHRVVRDPEETLGYVEQEVSREIAWGLAVNLNNLYPGFEIFDRLEAEGIEVS